MALVSLDSADNFSEFVDKFNSLSSNSGDINLLTSNADSLVAALNILDSATKNFDAERRIFDVYDSSGTKISP